MAKVNKAQVPSLIDRAIRKAIEAHERVNGDGEKIGGNGLTEGKFREPTISRLITNGRIGAIEIAAMEEIEKVYSYLCGGLFVHGYEIRERVDRAMPRDPSWWIDVYGRFRPWANYWSNRQKTMGDKTLSVIYDILFTRRSGKVIDDENGWRHGLCVAIFIAGLRDYALQAGWDSRGSRFQRTTVERSGIPLHRMPDVQA